MLQLTDLQNHLPELKIRTQVAYRELTTLGAGSTAPVVAEPDNVVQLSRLLNYCQERQINVFALSAGSNVVGMDEPYDGLIIHLMQGGFTQLSGNRDFLCAGCGVRLLQLANYAATHDGGGLAALSGIPGALGGALRMNAGASGTEIGRYVQKISGLYYSGQPYEAAGQDINWSYRGSSIPKEVIVTEVCLQLPEADGELEKAAIHTELLARRQREPQGRTAGCMFRNPPQTSAGRLIDAAGLKNYRIGDAQVSEKHANYLLNCGAATEQEIIALFKTVRKAVRRQAALELEPEMVFLNPAALPQILQEDK